jgi:hypothetical protein
MPQLDNTYIRSREQLRLFVRLFAAAQGEAERDRLMRDIERLVFHLAETMAGDQPGAEAPAANSDHTFGLSSVS